MHARTPLHPATPFSRRKLLIGAGVALPALTLRSRWSGQETPATTPDPEGKRPLRFYALGDTGAATETRAQAIAALAARAEHDPPDFVLLLGDNFYEFGIQSANDARWKTDFEDAFGAPSLRVPFHAVLGNHDHFGKVEAEIEYTKKSTRWKMPRRYHSFESHNYQSPPLTDPLASGRASTGAALFLLDTTPILSAEDHDLEQLAWLETELGKCEAPWKVAAGHHPLRTGGLHGGEPVPAELGPLFEQGGVDLYLSGHDHDLQLVLGPERWIQVVSGATAKPRETRRIDGTRFACSDPGFVLVELDDEAMRIEFVSAPGETRHEERIPRRERAAAGAR